VRGRYLDSARPKGLVDPVIELARELARAVQQLRRPAQELEAERRLAELPEPDPRRGIGEDALGAGRRLEERRLDLGRIAVGRYDDGDVLANAHLPKAAVDDRSRDEPRVRHDQVHVVARSNDSCPAADLGHVSDDVAHLDRVADLDRPLDEEDEPCDEVLDDILEPEAEPEVARRLDLPEGAPVVRIERVRYANDEPMAVETVYLDGQRFPEVGEQLSAVASLYSLLEEEYGVIPIEAEETIETVLAPPSASRLLGTDSSTPMLLLTRSSRDATGRPLEYVRSLYRGDRFRFIAKLTRPEY